MWETRALLHLQRDAAGWILNPLSLYAPGDSCVLNVNLALCVLLKVHLGTHDQVD